MAAGTIEITVPKRTSPSYFSSVIIPIVRVIFTAPISYLGKEDADSRLRESHVLIISNSQWVSFIFLIYGTELIIYSITFLISFMYFLKSIIFKTLLILPN